MITIVQQPAEFTPVGNPVIWQISSNNPNFRYFIVELVETTSGATIQVQPIFPAPDNATGAFVDISKILDAGVKGELNTSTTLLQPITKTIRSYRLKITEKILSSGAIIDGAVYNDTTEINYAWEAELERQAFKSFDYTDYVFTTWQNIATYLTNKPDNVQVNDSSVEYLYFFQDLPATPVYSNPYSISLTETPFYDSVDDRWYVHTSVSFSSLPSNITSIKLSWKAVGASNWMGSKTFTAPFSSPLLWDVLDVGDYKMELYAGAQLVTTIDPKNPTTTSYVYDNINFSFRFCNSSGVFYNSHTVFMSSGVNKMWRLDVSPASLQANGVSFANVAYYDLVVVDDNGDDLGVVRRYHYKPLECGKELVNLCFVNALGGVDSYQFHSPVETGSFSKFNIKQNMFGIDSAGDYTDNSDGIFNGTEATINNTGTSQIRVTSEALTDAEAYWLIEMFKSKQVWVKLSSGLFAPVQIQNSSYQVARLRLSKGQLNVITVDFKIADGLMRL